MPQENSKTEKSLSDYSGHILRRAFSIAPMSAGSPEKKEFYDYASWEHCYIAIDLKSFYASVECVERGLHPLKANLVVADDSRTDKTICLAVTPSLKGMGVSGRPRLFEVIQKVKEINEERAHTIRSTLSGSSSDGPTLREHPEMAVDYIVARPRMARYMEVSAQIYQLYLNYVAPSDILAYSVDEVFIDVTKYLRVHKMAADDLARAMIYRVLSETGITATAGVAPNLFLCKVAMDVKAKHVQSDENGVRIASLDEKTFRETMWTHEPITDFWRIGRGIATRLREMGLYTLGDVAMCAFMHEERLYQEFGVNAETLIDHAWGWEPCTLAEIKTYTPESSSLSSGQVLTEPYDFSKAKLVVREMIDLLVMDLVEKRIETDQIVLTVGYDAESLRDPSRASQYIGSVEVDLYGRKIPKHSQGTVNFRSHTSLTEEITDAVMELYDRVANPVLLVRRLNISACHIRPEPEEREFVPDDADLFFDAANFQKENERRRKEKSIQRTLLSIRKKYGGNAILKGMNLEPGATTRERNRQIGGHNAG